MKTFLLVCSIVLSVGSVQAHQGPSLDSVLDSVTLDVTNERNYQFVHTTAPKQTLYSLAKLYNCSLEQIYAANPELTERIVREFEEVKIPAGQIEIGPLSATGPKLYYRIKAKETLFRIARVYFDLSIEELKQLNDLENEDLKMHMKDSSKPTTHLSNQLVVNGWMSL